MSEIIDSFGGKDFFVTIVEEQDLLGLSSGYEGGDFRNQGLADLMFSALPDFALTFSELGTITSRNMIERLRRAVKTIYQSGKFKNRGEFGELLLHLVMRDYFGSVPAISKIYYKDSANSTVKGFDAVHVVPQGNDLSLWLGETKFYNNMSGAISSVVDEIKDHIKPEYLKNEFLLVSGKIEPSWPYAEKLKKLLDPKTSLDEVFNRLVVPVLLTYDSSSVQAHTEDSQKYRDELKEELIKHHGSFKGRDLPKEIEIVLIMVPLHTKETLAETLHNKLVHLQQGL